MSRIKQVFADLASQNHKALVSYITAGDPHPDKTVELMHSLVESGTDIIELGVPFSDPMADGPVIQQACERALVHDTSLASIIEMVKTFRNDDPDTPVVLMGYQNPIEIFGVDAFAKAASGFIDGVITVDLPPEESIDIAAIYKSNDIDTIYLLAPTTGEERIKAITKLASGFLYYVSFKGITGANKIDADSVTNKVAEIRSHTDIPVAVGFGIKDAQTAALVSDCSDAIVVGSAIVNIIADNQNDISHAGTKIRALLGDIKGALGNN
jgi:tryptophan synthase alpha chain